MTSAYSATQPVINLPDTDRATFISRVYTHLALAVGAFVAFETALFTGGIAQAMYEAMAGSRMMWMMLLGGFMVVSWLATNAAHDILNPSKQYLALFGIALANALIFAPYLYSVFNTSGAGTVWSAAVVTGIGFAGLSAVGYFTRSDLSFIRPIITWGFMLAGVAILGGLIFGFNLGLWFSIAMVGLSGCSILYKTQQIVRTYPADAHVGAAVQLFSSLMTLFWYILRIMSRR